MSKLFKALTGARKSVQQGGKAPFTSSSRELIQTPAQSLIQRLFGKTTGNRAVDSNLAAAYDNITAGKNLTNLIGNKRMLRAIQQRMDQRSITQKLLDSIIPGARNRRMQAMLKDTSIPEVREYIRNVGNIGKQVDNLNTDAVNAFGNFGAGIF